MGRLKLWWLKRKRDILLTEQGSLTSRIAAVNDIVKRFGCMNGHQQDILVTSSTRLGAVSIKLDLLKARYPELGQP